MFYKLETVGRKRAGGLFGHIILLGLGALLVLAACGGAGSTGTGSSNGGQTLTIMTIPNQEVGVGGNLELNVVVTGGADTGTTSYSVSPAAEAGATFVIDGNGELTIQVSDSATEATVNVTVTATRGSEMDSETFRLSIVSVLTISSISDQMVAIGGSLTLDVVAAGGADTGTISYSVLPADEAGATFVIDQATGQLTINASSASVATVNVTVTAMRGDSESDDETFRLIIVSGLTITEIPNQVVAIGGNLVLNVVVTGGLGTGAITYSVSPASGSGATFAIDQVTGRLTIDASSASEATVDITVTATRGSEMDSETFQLSIATSVTIVEILDQEVVIGTSRTLDVVAAGGTGTITYSVSPASDSGATFAIDSNGQLTIDATGATEATVDITVSAARGGNTDSETFELSIVPELTVESIADQTLRAGASDNINIQVITAGGLESDTVTYGVTGSVLVGRLVTIDSNGLLTIDASGEAGKDGPDEVTVTVTNPRVTETVRFDLTLDGPELTIQVNALDEDSSMCALSEGVTGLGDSITVRISSTALSNLRWQIESAGDFGPNDITDEDEVAIPRTLQTTPFPSSIEPTTKIDLTFRTRNDGTMTFPNAEMFTISILPSSDNRYSLPTTDGEGYTIASNGDVEIVCTSMDNTA